MNRHLRGPVALLLLLLLTAGPPVMLAMTIGNPLHGWDAFLAGDISDSVVLDVLTLIAWAAWVSFLWAVLSEILTLTAGISLPVLPALPGPRHLAHTLVTAAFVLLPSSAPLAHATPIAHAAPMANSPHLSNTARSGLANERPADPTGTAHASNRVAEGRPTAPAHRAAAGIGEAPFISSQAALDTGIGLLTGVSLRELARLRRRQWRHRRPGRAIPATPPHLAPAEKTLTRQRNTPVSDLERSQLLAAYANTQDQAMTPARGRTPWDQLSDAAGAPLPALADETTGESADQELSLSVLDTPIDQVLTTTATTAQDVTALAPTIAPRVRKLVDQTDPCLDEDLAAWRAAETTRPRLSLLGPVRVQAAGQLPSPRPRLAWHTEVVTYLAAHPNGVTPEKFGSDLWPGDPDIGAKPKLRQAIFGARHWLGTDPATGQEYIPQIKTPAGTAVYRVDGLLTDADLFRRLRLRGVTRGPDGIYDLEAALTLVTGPPLDPTQRRRDGYEWLIDTPIDTEYTAMIVDVAHLVATHHLSTGRPSLAAHAAQVSLTAGRHDDIPLLDLVAACDAQGHYAEAAMWIQRILAVHDTDIEEDLPPRTAEILHRRRWDRVRDTARVATGRA